MCAKSMVSCMDSSPKDNKSVIIYSPSFQNVNYSFFSFFCRTQMKYEKCLVGLVSMGACARAQHSSKYIMCVLQKKDLFFWNALIKIKWWKNSHFCISYLRHLLTSVGHVSSTILSFSHQPNSIHLWTPASTASIAVWADCQILDANLLSLPETQSLPSEGEPPSPHKEEGAQNSSPDLSKPHLLKKQIQCHLLSSRHLQRLHWKRRLPLHPLLNLEMLLGVTPISRP